MEKKEKIQIGIFIGALICALSVFAILLTLERNMVPEQKLMKVCVAKCDIPVGTLIDDSNASEYVLEREIEESLGGYYAYGSAEMLLGKSSAYLIPAGAILSDVYFLSDGQVLSELAKPVLVGFKAEDLYQVAGGVLRAGDYIELYGEDEETGEVNLLYPNLYVAQVFDVSGSEIARGEASGGAMRVNVYLEEAEVAHFYETVNARLLKVAKLYA